MNVSQRMALKRQRQWVGLTQLKLAELVGIKESDVTRYETGRANPSPSVALRMAQILNIDTSAIFPDLGLLDSNNKELR